MHDFITKMCLLGLVLVISFVAFQTPLHARVAESKYFKSNGGAAPTNAKIFLIAGSSQNANFAQEIIDQKAMWLREGFKEEEIACYYVVPDRIDFNNDETQWRGLQGDLADCYPASVRILREHLREAAATPRDFLYFFFTSHGQRPISMRLKYRSREDDGYGNMQRLARYPVMDEYLLTVEGLAQSRASLNDLTDAMDSGVPPQELFLTPKYLQQFLGRYFPDTPKFLVLQGCYSGGFLKDPRKERKKENLRELDQVTVLTAARFDRTSFGCDPGSDRTFFGGTFNDILADFIDRPLEMQWKKLYQAVDRQIAVMEEAYEDIRPSEPLFFSNFKKKD